MKLFLILLTIIFISPLAITGQSRSNHFHGENKFSKPIPITRSMHRVIEKDPDYDGCQDEWESGKFEATTVDLNQDGQPEYVVKGPCGNSATYFAYWFFAKDRNRLHLILVNSAMDFTIKRKRTDGWSNINFSGCNGRTCFYWDFVFNGHKYILKRKWNKEIDPLPR
jgi:hypothetical protein